MTHPDSTAAIAASPLSLWERGAGGVRSYPAYLDSGVPWLGSIPAHWQVKRLRYVTAVNTDVLPEDFDPDAEINYLDIGSVDSDGRILEKESFRFSDAPSRARRKVRSGDTIVSTVRTYLRAIAYMSDPPDGFIVSTGFAVLRPGAALWPPYLWRLIQSLPFVHAVVAHSEGVGYPAINPSRLAGLPVWIPPLAEQRAIAAYLDRETARLDALVAAKERLIALLREKRAALISRAVTRGLDPSAPMKDSGVPWLGAIPAHWQVKRLKYAAGLQTGLTLGKDYGKQTLVERPYLRVANVQDGFLDLSEVTTIVVPRQDVQRYELKRGDVLMTEGGDFDKLGRGFIWEEQLGGCLHQNHVFAIRPIRRLLASRYLTYLMSSSHGRTYFTLTSKQTTNLASTNSTTLGNFPVLLPSVEEQINIVTYLDRETAKLDALVATIRRHIEKVREYRAALIAAAVTGKIDAREREAANE